MKTKVLKLEGNEKIKFRIEIEYNEAKIILINGGSPTKFTKTIVFEGLNRINKDYIDVIAINCEALYKLFLVGVEFEKQILESFEDKINIEIEL